MESELERLVYGPCFGHSGPDADGEQTDRQTDCAHTHSGVPSLSFEPRISGIFAATGPPNPTVLTHN